MKTAVEWIAKELYEKFEFQISDGILYNEIIEKAKEMEKEQIVDAYNEGVISVDCRGGNSEKYYNQTFEQ